MNLMDNIRSDSSVHHFKRSLILSLCMSISIKGLCIADPDFYSRWTILIICLKRHRSLYFDGDKWYKSTLLEFELYKLALSDD